MKSTGSVFEFGRNVGLVGLDGFVLLKSDMRYWCGCLQEDEDEERW